MKKKPTIRIEVQHKNWEALLKTFQIDLAVQVTFIQKSIGPWGFFSLLTGQQKKLFFCYLRFNDRINHEQVRILLQNNRVPISIIIYEDFPTLKVFGSWEIVKKSLERKYQLI
jgi:hypothetical protein